MSASSGVLSKRSCTSSHDFSGNGSFSAKKALLSLSTLNMKDGRSAGVVDDFLHMDKLEFLPPCRVCNGSATGFHYGANTCEACKAFFRRYTGQEANLKPCKKVNKCIDIAKKGKVSCAKCRYERCIKVGMTKEGIKKGRYTYEKRFRDAVELHNRQLQAEREKLLDPERSEKLLNILTGAFSSSFPDVTYILNEKVDVDKQVNQLLEKVGLNDIDKVLFSGEGGKNSDKNEQLFYDHVESLASDSSCMTSVSSTTKFSITSNNKTCEMIWLGLSAQFELQLGTVCTFAKQIPGFNTLPYEDQLTLLKSACIEVRLMLRESCIHHDSDCLIKYYPQTKELGVVSLPLLFQQALTMDFVKFHTKLANRIHRLNLNVVDLSALFACIIMNPDCQGLQHIDTVESIQKSLLPALEYSLSHSHPEDPYIIPDTLLLLPMLRESCERYFLSSNDKGKIA